MSENVLAALRTGPMKTEFREFPMPEIPDDAAEKILTIKDAIVFIEANT